MKMTLENRIIFSLKIIYMILLIITGYVYSNELTTLFERPVIEIVEESPVELYVVTTVPNTLELLEKAVDTFGPIETPEPIVEEIIEEIVEEFEELFTAYELSLVERVVMSESGGESFDCQVAVAETIFNRVYSELYPNTIKSVVTQKNQYSMNNNGSPTDSVKQAVQKALYEPIHPEDMMYFREDFYHKNTIKYRKYGALYFSRQK